MNDYGTITEPQTIRLERLLPGPIERVWSYLTDSEKRGQWLAAGPMELRVGGGVNLTFDNSNLTRVREAVPEKYRQYERASFTGNVTRCEPPRLLSYTWAESWGGHSEVTFELAPRAGEVLLVLTHRKLEDRAGMVSVAAGWHTHLGILADVLGGRDSPGFWTTHSRLEADYERRIPA
jgi:uncharacterized protein YndB with AHSA1/START domain